MKKKHKTKSDGVFAKVFINCSGETLLCKGRLEFLEAIDKTGSISQAARLLGFSYRKAWSLVERTNRAAGRTIIETRSGGPKGGGASLTDDGRKLVALFREFLDENQKMAGDMWRRFEEAFPLQA